MLFINLFLCYLIYLTMYIMLSFNLLSELYCGPLCFNFFYLIYFQLLILFINLYLYHLIYF